MSKSENKNGGIGQNVKLKQLSTSNIRLSTISLKQSQLLVKIDL